MLSDVEIAQNAAVDLKATEQFVQAFNNRSSSLRSKKIPSSVRRGIFLLLTSNS